MPDLATIDKLEGVDVMDFGTRDQLPGFPFPQFRSYLIIANKLTHSAGATLIS
jgi:hypothetical protein